MTTDSAPSAVSVTFEHVTKTYGLDRERRSVPARAGADQAAVGAASGPPSAVLDLSFHVPAGCICALVGPSGCGKTTTLKLVNRLIEPTSGRILLDGSDAAARNATELRRGIGYVIQQVGLFPHLTVEENVGVVPELLGWDRVRRADRARELLGLVGLDPDRHAGRFPAELSGGERQRVGVARALAADPPLMLMDEPFGAVDPIVRERLQDEFLALQRRLAKTILFVTHDVDEAIKMGDLVAIMETTPEGGRLAQFGSPATVLAQPGSDFVAQFVGTDRALKRLSLARLSDLAFEPIGAGQESAEGPRLSPEATLRDALAALLQEDAGALTVVDGDGHPLGRVTIALVAAHLRRPEPAG